MREPSPEVDRLASLVIDAAMEVHRELDAGYLETVYEQALAIELKAREIPFSRQHPIRLQYKNHTVGEAKLDLLVGERLVVELKAVEAIHPIHHAQVFNYLKATRFELGLFNKLQCDTPQRGDETHCSNLNLSFLALVASWRFNN